MKINSYPKYPGKAFDEASSKLNQVLQKALSANQSVLLLLSGGSALSLLEKIDTENFGPHLTIGPLDERYYEDPKVNNWAQITATDFYKKAQSLDCQFIDTKVQLHETQQQLADRYHTALFEWMENNPTGIIIATVGIGEDGHTAGMMPMPENPKKFMTLFNGERLAVAYDAGDKNKYPMRVTTTITFFQQINEAVVLVTGNNKKIALENLCTDDGIYAETPARILVDILGNVSVYTDQD